LNRRIYADIDSTGLSWINDAYVDFGKVKVQLVLANPNPSVVAALERANLTRKIGREWIFVRVQARNSLTQQYRLLASRVRSSCWPATSPAAKWQRWSTPTFTCSLGRNESLCACRRVTGPALATSRAPLQGVLHCMPWVLATPTVVLLQQT
jgi:hypothetical protein